MTDTEVISLLLVLLGLISGMLLSQNFSLNLLAIMLVCSVFIVLATTGLLYASSILEFEAWKRKVFAVTKKTREREVKTRNV